MPPSCWALPLSRPPLNQPGCGPALSHPDCQQALPPPRDSTSPLFHDLRGGEWLSRFPGPVPGWQFQDSKPGSRFNPLLWPAIHLRQHPPPVWPIWTIIHSGCCTPRQRWRSQGNLGSAGSRWSPTSESSFPIMASAGPSIAACPTDLDSAHMTSPTSWATSTTSS